MKLITLCYLAGFVLSLTMGCVLPSEREGVPRTVNRRQTSNGVPIGTGDRYSAGTIAPRGVGSQTVTLTTILSVKEIASALKVRRISSHLYELEDSGSRGFEILLDCDDVNVYLIGSCSSVWGFYIHYTIYHLQWSRHLRW